ncbi:MAG: transglutaminase domain-containing protein [Bacteroidales bacterium]|nr:transglutaminase domain-containing protein [Bacteroidales bacterium]
MRKATIGCMLVFALSVAAQSTDFEKFREQQRASFSQFRDNQQDKYDAFRQRVNAEYAEFMRAAWAEFPVSEAEVPEPEPKVEPVVFDEDVEEIENGKLKIENEETEEGVEAQETEAEAQTNWSFSFGRTGNKEQGAKSEEEGQKSTRSDRPEERKVKSQREERGKSREIKAEGKVAVVPKATPAPAPIAPVAVSKTSDRKDIEISYYGRTITIGFPLTDRLRLQGLNEDALADAWTLLAGKPYDISVKTALDARSAFQLCDWAYMDALRMACEGHYGAGNEAVLMQTFLMTQSGYRVRLAKAGERLFMLVASKYQIYNMRYLNVEGTKYYVTGDYHGEKLQLCPSRFDKEQSLSLQMVALPKLGETASPKRKLTSKKGVTASVSVNRQLIDFFRRYPQANIDGDFTTRWAAYANTPLDQAIQDELYPPLRQTIRGMSEREAVGILLNWVQTAFKYGYDDEVWGGDRAFFVQETLFYPQSDCEDRAILFSRLVRDLTGLDVALIYYPGHLAAAVAFSGEEEGDWFNCGGQRFVVCDPTYINAPVGLTMPGMDNQKAKIILLR